MTVTSITDQSDGLYGWPTEPFGGCRLWDAHGTKSLYATKGEFDWVAMDRNVEFCLSQGKEVMYTFGGVANWMNGASDSCGTWACEAGKPPLNNEHWFSMVTAVVQRYKGKIKYYELWNEANVYPTGWAGTVSQLMQLVRGEYVIIRENDPGAVIISPTVCCSDTAYFTSLLENGAGDYADLIGFHGYVAGQSGATTTTRPPEAITRDLNAYNATMKATGYTNKQLIDTEGSWGLCLDNTVGFCGDEDRQAAYIAVRYILAASYGLHSFWWYAWNGDNEADTNWGSLWHAHAYPQYKTKAGRAYGVVNDWLVGAAVSSCNESTDHTWSCAITRSAGYKGQLVWNSTGSGNITVADWITRRRDLDGNTSSINPGSLMSLTNKPVLLESVAP